MPEGSTSSFSKMPAWVRLALPSVSDVVFVAMLAVLAFTPLSMRLLGDAGIGWHIRSGQLILATHSIPRTDVFSTTMYGKPWFAWEWLYDLPVGWLEHQAGLNGVVWFTAATIAAVFAWTFRLLVQRGADVLVGFALVMLAASASMIHFFARPHVVSWLLTLGWFWILDSFERRESRRVWVLPFLMLIWVNVHGGFLIGFVLLAIYWINAGWQAMTLRENKLEEFLAKLRANMRVLTLSKIFVVSLGATLVNPYGWQLHIHIYKYLSNRFLMDHIDEFQSPNFHGVAERCFAALLLITLAALAMQGHRLRLSEKLVVLFAVFSGLYSSRNIPVSSLLLAIVTAPVLSAVYPFRPIGTRAGGMAGTSAQIRSEIASSTPASFLGRMGRIELSLHGHLWPIAVLVVTGWVAFHGGHLGPPDLMDAHFNPRRFPVKAVDFLGKTTVAQSVLTPDFWGGYLIYRFYPKPIAAVDDRHDLYGGQFFKLYLKLVRVEPGWDELLQRHDIQCVLVPEGSALSNILALQASWHEIYRDEVGVVFTRRPAGIAESGTGPDVLATATGKQRIHSRVEQNSAH
jgi:hypothetical protein